jgi:hypothetical protein
MAIDFPSSPIAGQIFKGGELFYQFDGVAWNILGGATQPLITALARNIFINPAMVVSQERANTAGTLTSPNNWFPADQWSVSDGAATGASITAQRIQDALNRNRIRVTNNTAKGSLAAGDYFSIEQSLEGYRVADLKYGLATAVQTLLRFSFKAPAGTYCVNLRNSAGNRSFSFNVIVSALNANTDQTYIVPIPGDTTGTWDNTTGRGIDFRVTLAAGATFNGGTHNAWIAAASLATAAQTNGFATAGSVFELWDCGLYADPNLTLTSPVFEAPNFADELIRCQRYWEKSYAYGTAVGTNGGGVDGVEDFGVLGPPQACTVKFKVQKRISPTVTPYAAGGTVGKITTLGAVTTEETPASLDNISTNAFKVFHNTAGQTRLQFHWVANARV